MFIRVPLVEVDICEYVLDSDAEPEVSEMKMRTEMPFSEASLISG